MNALFNLGSNLIQNFYVVGLPPNKFFQLSDENIGSFLNIFKDKENSTVELIPEIISKYPPENGDFNSTNDELVVSHCFPQGLHIISNNNSKEDKKPISFEFQLENILFNYNKEERKIYSKIYFTCLEFYESLEKYNNYKNKIINNIAGNQKTSIKLRDKEFEEIIYDDKSLKSVYIPKIICFASLMPFTGKLLEILNLIYQTYTVNYPNNSVLPVEKLIEQIVLKLPIPISINTNFNLTFKLGKQSNNNDQKDKKKKSSSGKDVTMDSLSLVINFPAFNIKESYLKDYLSISMSECFTYFSPDDFIKIFKYIMLETPVLFFCQDKTTLTLFIETFLSILSPFNYVLPNISILPSEFYGLINSESKFLFGINQKYYPHFFSENNIDLDKNIVIVNIVDRENQNLNKIEEIQKHANEEINDLIMKNIANNKTLDKPKSNEDTIQNDYIIYNGSKTDLMSIDIPQSLKKKLSTKISEILSELKKKIKKGKNEEDFNFNYKIQHIFFEFFVNLLSGYSDYFLNSRDFMDDKKKCGFNIRYKSLNSQSDKNFLKEMFNVDEFVSKTKEGQTFYYAFFHTKIFLNYLREKVFFRQHVNSLSYKQFDFLVYLEKHAKNDKFYESFKKAVEKEKKKKDNEEITTKEIAITLGYDFTPEESKSILDENNKIDLLIKYCQLVEKGDGDSLSIDYCLFPKLLYDNFFEKNYYESFFLNPMNITMDKPDKRLIPDFRAANESFVKKIIGEKKDKIFPYFLQLLPITNNSKVHFEIASYSYVEFNWLILLCCSLWYCEQIEREIRLNKVFETLEKLEYIEEEVLSLVYMTFLKYGNKTQCIKMHETMLKFNGYSNYIFLSLLCLKLSQPADEESNSSHYQNEINSNDPSTIHDPNQNSTKRYELKKRSIILSSDSFFQKRCTVSSMSFSHSLMPGGYGKKSIRNTTSLSSGDIRTFNFPKIFGKNDKNKKGKKKRLIDGNSDINIQEKIIFSTEQFCSKCNKYNEFDFDIIMSQKMDTEKVNFTYKCINCKEEKKEEISIRYQIILYNKSRRESFITNIGEFQLLSPLRLYKELKMYLTCRKDYTFNIDSIYQENKKILLNSIFYFSQKNLPFDFLIPFKKTNDTDLEIFEDNLGSIISDINKKRFSIVDTPCSPERLTKNLTSKFDNKEFIPINISDSMYDNTKKFEDLFPCFSNESKIASSSIIYEDEIEKGKEEQMNTCSFSIVPKVAEVNQVKEENKENEKEICEEKNESEEEKIEGLEGLEGLKLIGLDGQGGEEGNEGGEEGDEEGGEGKNEGLEANLNIDNIDIMGVNGEGEEGEGEGDGEGKGGNADTNEKVENIDTFEVDENAENNENYENAGGNINEENKDEN